MIVRRQIVADVVKQGADDGLLVGAGALGSGRGLQAVRITVDRVAVGVALEPQQMGDDAIDDAFAIVAELGVDLAPVFRLAMVETSKSGAHADSCSECEVASA